MVIIPERGRGPSQRGWTVSLVDAGLHYLLDVRGTEELYDLAADPGEIRDIHKDPARGPALDRFRNALGEILMGIRSPGGPGSAYLKQLRSWLGSMAPPPRL